jgi:hypothetical protein
MKRRGFPYLDADVGRLLFLWLWSAVSTLLLQEHLNIVTILHFQTCGCICVVNSHSLEQEAYGVALL